MSLEMADLQQIRLHSWQKVANLGLPKNEALPLLECLTEIRPAEEVIDRLFAMHCAKASAFGFDRSKASEWLVREGGIGALTDLERNFLDGENVNAAPFREQIEGIGALCWCC